MLKSVITSTTAVVAWWRIALMVGAALGMIQPTTMRTTRSRAQRMLRWIPPGNWTSRGYGYVLSDYEFYEETNISCIVPNDEFLGAISQTGLLVDGAFGVFLEGAVAPISFDEVQNLKSGCARGITPMLGDEDYVRDALVDFDILVQTFAEHYAFFDIRNVNWTASTTEARRALSASSTDGELLAAFESILEPLNDGHVFVKSADRYFVSKPWEIMMLLASEATAQGVAANDTEGYIHAQDLRSESIVHGYMEGGAYNITPEFDVGFGRFAGNNKISYIFLARIDSDDQGGFAETLDKVFLALAGSRAMVVDMRINLGGHDDNALHLASHFVSERVLAYTKQAVAGDGNYTTKTEVYIEPGDEAYRHTGPVIVMTSGSTVGAAETFALAMSQVPDTSRLGRNTSGAFSDDLGRTLPNGWFFGLSNEVVAAPDGTVYEGAGIPPDIIPEADFFLLAERDAGIDSWLEEALQFLNATLTSEPTSAPVGDGEPSTVGTPPFEESGAKDESAQQLYLAALLAAVAVVPNA